MEKRKLIILFVVILAAILTLVLGFVIFGKKILFLPMALIFAPALALTFILGIILVVLIVLYIKKRKKVFLIGIIFIILLFLGSSLIIQAPIKGKVIDSVSGEPIKNIKVTKTSVINYIIIEPGGSTGKGDWLKEINTNNLGEYKFPWELKLPFPFFYKFEGSFISVMGWEKEFDCYGEDNFRTKEFVDCETETKGKYHHDGNFFYRGDMKTSSKISSRFKFLPVTTDIYMIPFVDNLEECNKSVKNELVELCRKRNAHQLAIKNKNVELCEIVGAEMHDEEMTIGICIVDVAIETNNPELCNLLVERERRVISSDSCRREIAMMYQNKTLCEETPNSKWVKGLESERGYCDYTK